MTAVTFALLLLAAQVAIKRAATLLVGIDVEIDALVTDGGSMFQFQTTGDLFRTPLLPQQQFNQQPG